MELRLTDVSAMLSFISICGGGPMRIRNHTFSLKSRNSISINLFAMLAVCIVYTPCSVRIKLPSIRFFESCQSCFALFVFFVVVAAAIALGRDS